MTNLLDPTIRVTYDADEPPSWDGTLMSADTGPVQWRSKRSKPRHQLSLVYQKSIDQAGQLDTLTDWFRAQCNPFAPFYLYTPLMWRRWGGVSAGAGTGSQLAFPFPGREVDPGSDTVTVAGVTKINGLAAINADYMLGYENRALQSEDFSQTGQWAVQGGATVTRTSGQTDPLGGTTAWRIQTSGGSTALQLSQAIAGTPAAAQKTYLEIWVKVQGSYAVTITDGMGGTVTLPVGGGWVKVGLTGTGNASLTQSVSFSAPAAANALDFFVWRPWTAWQVVGQFGQPPSSWGGYVPTAASAITMDATGKQQIVFFAGKAPANLAAVVISYRGRRLLLGTFLDDPDGPHIAGFRQLKLSVSVSGEEQ